VHSQAAIKKDVIHRAPSCISIRLYDTHRQQPGAANGTIQEQLGPRTIETTMINTEGSNRAPSDGRNPAVLL